MIRTLDCAINDEQGGPVFEEFTGIPMHPLLVHAAVVFVPLLALVAIAYGFVPFLRPHTRWALIVLAIITPGAVWFAKLSGEAFFDRGVERGDITGGFIPVIEEHQNFGTMTAYFTSGLAVLTLVLVYMVAPRLSAAAVGGRSFGGGASPAVRWVLAVLVAVVGVVSIYYVVRTGDSGAHAVWEGR
jgi:hypothetical protein